MALRRSAAALALLAVLAFAASAQGSPEREAHLKHQQVAEVSRRMEAMFQINTAAPSSTCPMPRPSQT